MRAGAAIGRVRGFAVLPLIVAALAAIPAGQARASATVRAHVSGAVPAAVLAGTGVLDDVVATSARNAWAVGHFGPLSQPRTLIEHWNGKTWQRVRVAPAHGWLNGVAATSARDVWVVGFSGSATLILHFNGTSWRRVPSPPSSGGILADVTAVSPGDAWAVGVTGGGSLIVHWNGKAWRRVHSPSRAFIVGVSAHSAKDIWAVGGLRGTVTLHWNGTAWRRVKSPSPASGATLESVAAISAHDVWAVGETARGTLILRWNGSRWQKVSSPAVAKGAGLLGVSGRSVHDVWAAGTTGGLVVTVTADEISPRLVRNAAGGAMSIVAGTTSAVQKVEPVILHWNGESWRRVRIQSPANGGQLIGVFALSGRTALAVGCTKNFGARNAKPLVVDLHGHTGFFDAKTSP
jgi:hypothetical protein